MKFKSMKSKKIGFNRFFITLLSLSLALSAAAWAGSGDGSGTRGGGDELGLEVRAALMDVAHDVHGWAKFFVNDADISSLSTRVLVSSQITSVVSVSSDSVIDFEPGEIFVNRDGWKSITVWSEKKITIFRAILQYKHLNGDLVDGASLQYANLLLNERDAETLATPELSGLEVKAQFKVAVFQAVTLLHQRAKEFPHLDLKLLDAAEKSVIIDATSAALVVKLDGLTQESTALNDPAMSKVWVSIPRWSAISSDALKREIALHEVLSLMKVESTGNYEISSRILK